MLRSDHKSEELTEATLRLVLVCSLKCEQNRVALIQNGILASLVDCMTSGPLVIRVCKVWIALVQDDDVSVQLEVAGHVESPLLRGGEVGHPGVFYLAQPEVLYQSINLQQVGK